MRLLTVLLAGLLVMPALGGCAAPAKRVGAASKPAAVKKPLRKHVLTNGLTLVVKEGRKGGPTALQAWITRGSMSDPEGKPGLAHFVEHMLFTGSLHAPKGRMEQYLEGMGGRVQGHTGRDYSYIGVTLPGGGWQRALDILFDAVAYPAFLPEEVERQRGVILLEIAQRKRDPDTLVVDKLFEAAYAAHPYKNPVAGASKDVSGFTREDVASYYGRTYVPYNMVLVVVGDVDAAEVAAMAEKTFGKLTLTEAGRLRYQPESFQAYTRTTTEEGPYSLAYMALGWHICSASDPDMYAVEVLRAILGQGRGSRLYQELRERMGAASDIEARIFPLKDPGMLAVTAHLKQEDVRRVTGEVLRQVNKLKDEPVSGEDLARAVGGIEAEHLLDNETAEGQAFGLGYWAAVYGDEDPARYMRNIRAVTPDDLRRVAQKYLGEGNYTLSLVTPGAGAR